jgi:hypothetical protein
MKRFGCVLLLALGLNAAVPADEGPVERPGLFAGESRFWSLGAALGSSFTVPWLIGTIQGTAAFFPYTMVELGCDAGFVHGYRDEPGMGYVSFYPFGHINGYVPLKVPGVRCGWYGGAGGGIMLAVYRIDGEARSYQAPALDVTTGLHAGRGRHYLTLGYTLRTNFTAFNHKAAVGYCYRFGGKEE